jgi:uncharacterized iron-regulated membrane protein
MVDTPLLEKPATAVTEVDQNANNRLTSSNTFRVAKLRRHIRRVHFILATISGILLSIVTVSGALVIFRTELDWMYADTMTAAGPRQAKTDETVAAIYQRYGAVRIQRLATPAFTKRGDEWTIRDEKGTPSSEDDDVWKVFTDPISGQWLGDTRHATGSALIAWIARFHHNLWLGPVGGFLVGTAGLCLLGFVVSGLWLWWPGIKRLSNGFRLRLNKPGFMRNYDVHAWVGMIGIPIFIIVGITGSMFEFRWVRTTVHYGLGGSDSDLPMRLRQRPLTPAANKQSSATEAPISTTQHQAQKAEKPRVEHNSDAGGETTQTQIASQAPITFSQSITIAETAVPGTRALSVSPPRTNRPDATWSILLDYPSNVGSYSGVLTQLTNNGNVQLIIDPRTMSLGGWANQQLWGLHTGTWAGVCSKMLYLMIGLLPPILLVTGFLLWWYRHRQKRIAKNAPLT